MIFNTTASAHYPQRKENADKRCNEIARELSEQVSVFFSNVGTDKRFDVPNMDILNRSSNLSTGRADVRCVICEIAANICDTETLQSLANHLASASNFNTRKSHSRKPEYKGYDGAVEFMRNTERLFLSIGVMPEQISKSVYQAVILYSRLILIRLWREGLVVLPITLNMELGTKKLVDFTKFKCSNHPSKPPIFGATDEYCESLQTEFTKLINDIGNAPSLELDLMELEGGTCYDKVSGILYCSTLQSRKDVTVESYDDLTRLFCLYV